MKRYLFRTQTAMKEYNRDNWWIDTDIVEPIEIDAESLNEALKEYAAEVNRTSCIEISKTALKRKSDMYIDANDGTKHIGYVITGKVEMQRDDYKWSIQYVDLWTRIDVLTSIETEVAA